VNKPEPLLSFVRCFLVGLNSGFLFLIKGHIMANSISRIKISSEFSYITLDDNGGMVLGVFLERL